MIAKGQPPSTCQATHLGGAGPLLRDVPCSWCQLLATCTLSPAAAHLKGFWLSGSHCIGFREPCTVDTTILQVHLHFNPFPLGIDLPIIANPVLGLFPASFSNSLSARKLQFKVLGMICKVLGHLTSPLFSRLISPISPNTPSFQRCWTFSGCWNVQMVSTAFIPFMYCLSGLGWSNYIPSHHLKILLMMMKIVEGK